MRFDVLTLFPEMIEHAMSQSVIGRAGTQGIIDINAVDIRNYSTDKHRRVDDYPYGGGYGMVMQCQPIYDCYMDVTKDAKTKPHTIYMSPKGKVLTQKRAVELSKLDRVVILCGHYEGIDQRVLDEIVDEEISIGDYVLTGGELAACVVIDSVSRMIDGVLADSEAFEKESHFNGLLEHPQYTRPEVWNGKRVPDILLSGHHANIQKWQHEQSVEITKKYRPDMLKESQK